MKCPPLAGCRFVAMETLQPNSYRARALLLLMHSVSGARNTDNPYRRAVAARYARRVLACVRAARQTIRPARAAPPSCDAHRGSGGAIARAEISPAAWRV